jgi:hypothetical protein
MYEAKGERASHVYRLRVQIRDGALTELKPGDLIDPLPASPPATPRV